MMRKILFGYYYLFYKFFCGLVCVNRWRQGKSNNEEFFYDQAIAASAVLLFFMLIFFSSFLEITEKKIGHGFSQFISFGEFYWYLFALLTFFINYFILVKNEKYKKIVSHFRNESKKQRFWGTIATYCFAIGSVALPFILISVFKK